MSKKELKIKENQGPTGYSTARIVEEKGFLETETKFIERIDNITKGAVEKVVKEAITRGLIIPKR